MQGRLTSVDPRKSKPEHYVWCPFEMVWTSRDISSVTGERFAKDDDYS